MVKYNCDTCKKVFRQKIDFDRHKNRKIKCIFINLDGIIDDIQNSTNPPKSPPITEIIPPIYTNITPIQVIDENHNKKCINCNKQFSRIDSYKRHMMFRCKFTIEPIKKDDNQVINLLTQIKEQQIKSDQKIEELQIKNNELRTTIDELKATSIRSITNTNSHNTTNINNNVIIKFGEEDAKSILSKKDIQYIVDAHKEYLLQRSIEVTHCNNKYPSLQNIYVPDKRMQMINIYNGEKYELKNIENVIMELITTHQNNLDDYRMMKEIKIDGEKREDMEEYVDNFHRFNESSSDHKKQIYDSVINEVKLLLYNNKDKVKDTERHKKRIKG